MSLLQRRLFVEFAKVFALALTVLLLFILMGRALQMRNMLLGMEMTALDSLRLFGYLSPLFLIMVCPVACMLAVFLTFLRMSTDRELVALRAGGISLYQLLPAPLIFGFLCTLLGLSLSLHWQAWGMSHFRSEVLNIASGNARIVVQPGVFNREIPDMVFFARQVDPVAGTLAHVLVEDSSRPETKLIILAPEGNLGADFDRGDLLFLLKHGHIYTERGNAVSVMDFEEYVVRLALSSLFSGLDLGPIKPNEMSWGELLSVPVRQVTASNTRFENKVVVERNKRWLYPLACLILTVFAIPLATSFQGLQRQSGMVLALVIFLGYFSILNLGQSLGDSGMVSPLLGLWLPSGLFVAAGIYGIHLAAQERMPSVTNLLRHWGRKGSDKAGTDGAAPGEQA